MKKLLKLALALTLVVSLSACAEEERTVATSGRATGYGGELVVNIEYLGDDILSVGVVKHSETESVIGDTLGDITMAIVVEDTTDVDVVAGATVTSKAIMAAVNNALDPEKYPYNPEVIEEFSAEYEMVGTTSSGAPKNDTFIFKGKTTNDVITELTFDVIRNKGLDSEYSKTDIMGYMMNVSDAEVLVESGTAKLVKLTSYGYDPEYADGAAAQFGVTASIDTLTETTKFSDLTFANLFGSNELPLEKALIAYAPLAQEAGIELTEDTLVSEIISLHGFYKDGEFITGSTRVSFEGIAGGRSYGEQIQAIADYIVEQGLTLEETYEMFKTVNQSSEPIEERDTVAGATITFVGDFQRMVYVAMFGEVFEGVITHTTTEGITKMEVVTQGYAGEIETHVSVDENGTITSVVVRDANETPTYGGVLTATDSDFLTSIVEKNSAVDVVAGTTVTSNAINKAVELALEYYNSLA